MNNTLMLNRNEVLQGPSPNCLKVLRNFPSHKASCYFDGYFESALIPKLSELFVIPRSHIIIGYGLEDILRMIFNTLRPAKDIVLTPEFHFTYYDKYLTFRNIQLKNFAVIQQTNKFVFDIEDCLKKIKQLKPKMVLITSPNNPTGHTLPVGDLAEILRVAAPSTLVVLDEAYVGFDTHYNKLAFVALLKKHKNFMILRSFSKLYALAGLRIAFALCGADVKRMLGYQHFYLGGSRILEDAAVAALESVKYYKKLSSEIIRDREQFISHVNTLKTFKAFESQANFVLVKVHGKGRAMLEQKLRNAKAIIYKFVSDDCMRVTIGSKYHTNTFLDALDVIDTSI